jgi:S-adenosyl-L-methionine hydrolase (adenosine-forming)
VGIVKGVLLREGPTLQVVDLSHEVPPQAVSVAAFWLAHSYRFFPARTVHLCVVDPGVGSARAPIAARALGHYFVAPDNGLLSDVLAADGSARVHRIEPDRLGLDVTSRTFHGRDLFAPVAARLASGQISLSELGPPHAALMEQRAIPVRDASGISGAVLFADHFGNLVTDIPGALLKPRGERVVVAGAELRVLGTYADARAGECIGLVSSFGTLEIAQRDGSAASALGVGRGAPIRVLASEET